MRIIRNILAFCRDFVVGDDWTLVVVVLWSLASLSLIVDYYTAYKTWYMLPLGITGGLALSVRIPLLQHRRKHPIHVGAKLHWIFNKVNQVVLGLWFPLVGTVIFAFFAEQSFNSNISLETFWVPAALELLALLLIGLAISPFFMEYPLATSICAVVIAIAFSRNLQAPIVHFAGTLSLPLAYFTFIGALALSILVVIGGMWLLSVYNEKANA